MKPKRAICYARRNLAHQVEWGKAFAAGLVRHGYEAIITDDISAQGDLFCMWSTRYVAQVRRNRRRDCELVIFERGYFGDRFKWTSVSFGGGLNNRGRFYGPFNDGSRLQKHFPNLLQPWRQRPDGYALILCQIEQDMAMRNCNAERFYKRAETSMRALGIEPRRRAHPNVNPLRNGNLAMRNAAYSLAQDLSGARLAITWNSNSGTDAVVAGVPTITMDEGAMAFPVTGHEYTAEPPTPDRLAWAQATAWKQWTIDELAGGYCWDTINPCAMAPSNVA